jgi:hypothetical protein
MAAATSSWRAAWRRSRAATFKTAHLTWPSAFRWVNWGARVGGEGRRGKGALLNMVRIGQLSNYGCEGDEGAARAS